MSFWSQTTRRKHSTSFTAQVRISLLTADFMIVLSRSPGVCWVTLLFKVWRHRISWRNVQLFTFQAGSTASDAACFHSPILRAAGTCNIQGNFLPGYSMCLLNTFLPCMYFPTALCAEGYSASSPLLFLSWAIQTGISFHNRECCLFWYCFSVFNPVLIYSCWIAKAFGKWEEGPLFALKCNAAPLISPSSWESLNLSDQYDPVMIIFSVVKSLQILTFMKKK